MKYYLHDSNSFQDEKITELFIKFGYEGLGLFYTILEKLSFQEKPIKTKILKNQLKVGKRLNRCWNFMEEIGLISSINDETFNENILKFSEKYQIKKEKNRKKISEWRDNQKNTKNVTGYEPVRNPPKVNKSKVNKSKDNKDYKKLLLSELKNSDIKNSKYLEIAKSFQTLFIANMKEIGLKNTSIEKAKGTWYDDIRLLIEVDNRELSEIREVWDFIKRDSFWKENIRSTKKLREKFETLLIKSKKNGDHKNSNQQGATWDEIGAILEKHFGDLPD